MEEEKAMDRDYLVENFISTLPTLYKKFYKGLLVCEISAQQLALLHCLYKDGEQTMTYYCNKLLISKPNMTIISDKLVAEGLIERVFLPKDRRVILLKLTPKGKQFLIEQKEKFKKEMINKLHNLSDDDVARLNELFEEIKKIINKIPE